MGNPRKIATEAVLINASKQEVWNLLFHRFGETHLFNPNVEGSHGTNGKDGQVGCERQCSINQKTNVKERIVKAEEFQSITVDIIGGNMPMVNEMQVIMLIEPVSLTQTKVLINATYTTKPSFMAGIVKGMFRKMLFGVLVGLKYYLETGNAVSKKSFKSISGKYRSLQGSQAFVA